MNKYRKYFDLYNILVGGGDPNMNLDEKKEKFKKEVENLRIKERKYRFMILELIDRTDLVPKFYELIDFTNAFIL